MAKRRLIAVDGWLNAVMCIRVCCDGYRPIPICIDHHQSLPGVNYLENSMYKKFWLKLGDGIFPLMISWLLAAGLLHKLFEMLSNGLEKFLLMSLDDPGKTKLCLDRMKQITIDFGRAQIEAGADALTLPDHATGDLVSGDYYDRYLRELHIEFVEQIPIPLILHICGRTVDRMEYIAQTGMAAFHFDSKNAPPESMEIVADRIALVGNINNPETLYSKGPEVVREEVIGNLAAGVQLVGPECAIPLQTPIECLKEIPLAVRDWHREHVA